MMCHALPFRPLWHQSLGRKTFDRSGGEKRVRCVTELKHFAKLVTLASCYQSQQLPANRAIQPRYVQRNHRIAGAGAVERGARAAAARCAQGEARRKGARLTRTGKGSVCAFRTPSEPEVDSKSDM